MTFQQLKYLSAIEKYGSFNEAARQLYISQSSISSAVKELEQELGIAIFNRSSRGAELTPQRRERVIRVFERSTLFSIISHTDAYNIGSGLLPEKYLPSYTAVPIAGDSDAFMTVGWVCRRGGELSEPALDYIGLISHFADRYEALHRQP